MKTFEVGKIYQSCDNKHRRIFVVGRTPCFIKVQHIVDGNHALDNTVRLKTRSTLGNSGEMVFDATDTYHAASEVTERPVVAGVSMAADDVVKSEAKLAVMEENQPKLGSIDESQPKLESDLMPHTAVVIYPYWANDLDQAKPKLLADEYAEEHVYVNCESSAVVRFVPGKYYALQNDHYVAFFRVNSRVDGNCFVYLNVSEAAPSPSGPIFGPELIGSLKIDKNRVEYAHNIGASLLDCHLRLYATNLFSLDDVTDDPWTCNDMSLLYKHRLIQSFEIAFKDSYCNENPARLHPKNHHPTYEEALQKVWLEKRERLLGLRTYDDVYYAIRSEGYVINQTRLTVESKRFKPCDIKVGGR